MSQPPALVVNVRELLRQPGAHRRISLRNPVPGLETPVAAVLPERVVEVEAEVESVVEGLLVTGEVSATATVRCARCLCEFDRPVASHVQELFVTDPSDAEDDGYAVTPDERLVLDTMVRDVVVLALPMAPLCRDDCAGLCPSCGADRNETLCGHELETPLDPRWLALAQLRLDGADEPNEMS